MQSTKSARRSDRLGQALMVRSVTCDGCSQSRALARLHHVHQLQIAVAVIARDPSRSRFGCHGSRPGHYCAGRQQFRFGHILILTQNHGPVVHPWYHRDMDAGDHLSMHARDDAMVNKRHRMHANHRLHACDVHDAIDMPYIVCARYVGVFDPMHVMILRSRYIMVTRAGDVAVPVYIADLMHSVVPVDRTHLGRAGRLPAFFHFARASCLRR